MQQRLRNRYPAVVMREHMPLVECLVSVKLVKWFEFGKELADFPMNLDLLQTFVNNYELSLF